jgi:hypothetical protein
MTQSVKNPDTLKPMKINKNKIKKRLKKYVIHHVGGISLVGNPGKIKVI